MRVNNLSFGYKNAPIFNAVDFEVHGGEILMVLGINGVGKSTLMKCLAGIFSHGGTVDLEGIKRTQIGYMNQNITPCEALSVFEFVLLGRIGELGMRVRDEDLERTEHVIAHVGITHLARKNFSELSGGQQRLVIVAQMLAKEPKLMLLDEPTANLDIVREREIMELIRAYCTSYRVPVIINMHNITQAFEYADKMLLLSPALKGAAAGAGGGVAAYEMARTGSAGVGAEVAYFGDKAGLDLGLLGRCFGVRFDEFFNARGERVIADSNLLG